MMRKALVKKALTSMDFEESEGARLLARQVAKAEAQQIDAANRLIDAADLEDSIGFDLEARENTLLSFANAFSDGEAARWYLGNYLGVANLTSALNFVGLDRADWANQIETWAILYRDKAPDEVAGMTDAEITDMHVQNTFGVPLSVFSRHVVDFTPGLAVEAVLLDQLTQVEGAMLTVAAEIEGAEA